MIEEEKETSQEGGSKTQDNKKEQRGFWLPLLFFIGQKFHARQRQF